MLGGTAFARGSTVATWLGDGGEFGWSGRWRMVGGSAFAISPVGFAFALSLLGLALPPSALPVSALAVSGAVLALDFEGDAFARCPLVDGSGGSEATCAGARPA